MKVAVFGTLPFSDLIKEGFKSMGHEITNEDPDLIYSNDREQFDKKSIVKNILKVKK